MDVKTDIIVPASPLPASSLPAAGGRAAAPERGAAGKEPDFATVQEVLRDALNVEPVADRKLRIEFEKELHQIVVKVFDKDTGELVRQIPMPEEISIAKGLREAIRRMAGDQTGIAVSQEV
ncbi:MAG: flagellar protein FlaG [Thermodesulfobacteriota bacterium]